MHKTERLVTIELQEFVHNSRQLKRFSVDMRSCCNW